MSEERKALYDDIGKSIRNAKPGELDHELAIIAAYRAGVAVGTDLASAQYEEAKGVVIAEAIKEFAERLKSELRGLAVCTANSVTNKIDILAKEMTQQQPKPTHKNRRKGDRAQDEPEKTAS